MSAPSPRWAAVKAKMPGLKTAFGVGGVGAFWIDQFGIPQEHYEPSAYDLLEWFEKQLGIGTTQHEQTASEKMILQQQEEQRKALDRQGVRLALEDDWKLERRRVRWMDIKWGMGRFTAEWEGIDGDRKREWARTESELIGLVRDAIDQSEVDKLESQKYQVPNGQTIRAYLGQPQPVEMPKPKEQVKPKSPSDAYRRKFG